MKKNKGFSLIEILVASVILAMVVGATALVHVSIRELSSQLAGYRYTALNLAREVLEFGEAGRFAHEFELAYYYPPATKCTLPRGCGGGYGGKDTSKAGYKLREWWNFAPGNPDPFDYLGDIKVKGLVPKEAPDSARIYYYAHPAPNFYNQYQETVIVTWEEEAGGARKREALSVIPIRHVNDQLQLLTAEFWWE